MILPDSNRSHVVFIGGRSGVGKTSVAAEMHAKLGEIGIQHAVIEGDVLDLAWPPPWEHGLAEQNLAAIWRNYRELGYRRLVYTNTVSVLEFETLAKAMGDDPEVTTVLLTCEDRTAKERLTGREVGSQRDEHIARSSARAIELEREAPANVVRVATDHRSVAEIAEDILKITGWNQAGRDENHD